MKELQGVLKGKRRASPSEHSEQVGAVSRDMFDERVCVSDDQNIYQPVWGGTKQQTLALNNQYSCTVLLSPVCRVDGVRGKR